MPISSLPSFLRYYKYRPPLLPLLLGKSCGVCLLSFILTPTLFTSSSTSKTVGKSKYENVRFVKLHCIPPIPTLLYPTYPTPSSIQHCMPVGRGQETDKRQPTHPPPKKLNPISPPSFFRTCHQPFIPTKITPPASLPSLFVCLYMHKVSYHSFTRGTPKQASKHEIYAASAATGCGVAASCTRGGCCTVRWRGSM